MAHLEARNSLPSHRFLADACPPALYNVVTPLVVVWLITRLSSERAKSELFFVFVAISDSNTQM